MTALGVLALVTGKMTPGATPHQTVTQVLAGGDVHTPGVIEVPRLGTPGPRRG